MSPGAQIECAFGWRLAQTVHTAVATKSTAMMVQIRMFEVFRICLNSARLVNLVHCFKHTARYIAWQGRVVERGCILLAFTEHPSQKCGNGLSFPWVLHVFGHENPSEARYRVGI